MCKFSSLVSKGDGEPMYFDYKIRKQILSGKLNYELDSHTSIADYFGYKAEKEDKLNKYEYNPLTKVFGVDQLNTTDDSEKIKKFCLGLDFKLIVPELIIKPIIHPFKDIQTTEVTKDDLKLLKKWASVRDSVGAYCGSFIDIKYKYNLKPAQELWERGLVPAYNSKDKIWYLCGANGKIVWQGTIKERI